MLKIQDDKLLHFSFSCILLFGTTIFFPFIESLVIVISIGWLKEIWDEYYGNGWSWGDIIANIVGILLGVIILILK